MLVRGCPRFSEALNEVLKEEDVKKKIDEQQEIYKYLTEHAGVEVKDPWGVEDIYSTLKAEVKSFIYLTLFRMSIFCCFF